MKLLILLGSILLLVTIGIAETLPKISTPLAEAELNKYQYCGTDADCMLVRNGCCKCENFTAINREHQQKFEKQFDCLKASCPTTETTTCNQGVVSCVEHKCKYFNEVK